MNWLDPIDQYCERLGTGLFAEPLNLFSNAAFFFAAFFVLQKARRVFGSALPVGIAVGTILISLVGVGSALFHSLGVFWAMMADVVPIGIFLFYFLWLYLRGACGYTKRQAVVGLVGFLLLTGALSLVVAKEAVNGSQMYFGAFATLLLIAAFEGRKQSAARGPFLAAFVAFGFSLAFRSVDLRLCEVWPSGTHFLWHGLNGLTVYLAMGGLVASWQRQSS